MYVTVPPVCSACQGEKQSLDPLELELENVVIHHVGAENKPRPFQEQPVLLTTEHSLQVLKNLIFLKQNTHFVALISLLL